MKVAIVGSGVTGMVAALRIKDKYPEAKMTVFDAGPDPRISSRTDSHHPSWGDDKTKIVRQLTGSESLSLPESEAILIDEYHETGNYEGTIEINNLSHVKLNYLGIEEWLKFLKSNPEAEEFIIGEGSVAVFHTNEDSLLKDFQLELDLYNAVYQNDVFMAKPEIKNGNGICSGVFNGTKVYQDSYLTVPGLAIRIRDFLLWALSKLELEGTDFKFNEKVDSLKELTGFDVVISATGDSGHHKRFKILHGFWYSTPLLNLRMDLPAKLALELPYGYMNITSNKDRMHIVGIVSINKPSKEVFVEAIKSYFSKSIIESLNENEIIECNRPFNGLYGLPMMESENNIIYVGGGGKSGATHAFVVADYVIGQIEKIMRGKV